MTLFLLKKLVVYKHGSLSICVGKAAVGEDVSVPQKDWLTQSVILHPLSEAVPNAISCRVKVFFALCANKPLQHEHI